MAASRLALITGSTSGIGLSVAKTLATKFNNIVLNGFATEEQQKEVVEAVRKSGADVKVEFHGADLSKPNEIRELVDFCAKTFGRTPDILVNNAGERKHTLHLLVSS